MSEVTCRGSFALGTACGKCSRCRREIESYNAMKAVRDKLNTPSSALSRIEELEAKLDWVLVERDETFALMLDRAQTAEAKLAKAVEFISNLKQYAVAIDDRHLHGKTVATLAELTGGEDEDEI